MPVRIIIVEDDIDDIVLLNEIFSETEYANLTQFFHNPEGLIPYLDSAPAVELPSIIISDLNMPKLNGFELLNTLKENEHYQHIPVIICTTSASEKDKQRALSLGASDFITKPNAKSDYAKLIEVIRRILKQE